MIAQRTSGATAQPSRMENGKSPGRQALMHTVSDASPGKGSTATSHSHFHNSLIHKDFRFCQFCVQRKQTLVPQGFAAYAWWISTKLSTTSVNTCKTPFAIKHLARFPRCRMNRTAQLDRPSESYSPASTSPPCPAPTFTIGAVRNLCTAARFSVPQVDRADFHKSHFHGFPSC